MMLVAILNGQYERFDGLAESWLLMGAQAFGVWSGGRPIAYWPAGHKIADASLVAPICVDGECVGELRVAGITGAAAQSRLGVDAGLVGHLAKLEDELQCMTADLVTSQDQLLAMYRLTESMGNQITINEILDALVGEALRITKVCGGFAVFVADGNPPVVATSPALPFTEDFVWRCFWEAHSGEHEVRVSMADLQASLGDKAAEVFFIPIRTRGAITSGLGLLQKPGRDFDMPDVKLIRAIGDQASAQIEKVMLYQESIDQAKLRTEMDLARRVQFDLLPRQSPTIAGLDVYAASRPAFEVGGDFYDFIDEPGKPFMFTVGDVTGKGLSAALLMTMTRTAIHSKASFMPKPSPEAIMRQSNEDLYNDFTQVGVFATAFVGQYDASNQHVIYANAGHSPVIYRPHDGEPVLLQADSTAIGVLETSYSRNQVIALRPHDLLIVATDGFSEAHDQHDELFDYERLLQLTDELAHRSAREIADALFDAVDKFSKGRAQTDDQTLVVIKGVVM